jgi:hypothetical protein
MQAAPLRITGAVIIETAHAGLRGEGDEDGLGQLVDLATAEVVAFLCEDDDGAALGGFIGEGGELGRLGHFRLGDARGRDEFRCLAIAEGDGAGLVQEEDVHVAGGLDGPPAHGEDVFLDEAVDAGDADGAQQQPPMVVGMMQTSSATRR